MKTQTFILPAAWASAIANCDYSGMTEEDTSACNTFLAENRLSFKDCLFVDPHGFAKHHDAFAQMPLACDCGEFTFPA